MRVAGFACLLALFVLTLVGCASTVPAGIEDADPLQQRPEALLAGTARAVAYSGYRSGQHPDRGAGAKDPSRAEVLEDLRLLTRDGNFGLIRLYDSHPLSRMVLELIAEHELPMKVMLGAWLKAELSNHEGCAWLTEPIPEAELKANIAENEKEVLRAIDLARRFPEIVVAVNVGNEALVSWNDHLVSIEAMVGYLRQVQEAIRQPVTTADNYVAWIEKGKALAEVVDFAAVHTYPLWEGRTVDQGMEFTLENLRAVREANPSLPIVIAEAGWATVASEFPERAGEAQQKRYFDELMRWAAEKNVTTFFFEAFDEDWKGNPANPDGAEKHWGLFTIDRTPKSVMHALYGDLRR
jgi:exo-beta-1,3-glucanase (GH17 family)